MKRHSIPDTHGKLKIISGTDPAAGADPTLVADANTRWRIITVKAELVTDATVATRQARLELVVGGNTMFTVWSQVTHAASIDNTYFWYPGGPDRSAAISNTINTGLPIEILMSGANQLQIQTNNLQAGDNWSAITAYIEEWIEE
jgi:hypothetical protein